MGFLAWFRSVRKRSRRTVNGRQWLLAEPEFRFEVARERVRADRSHLPLSILVIELPADRSAPRDVVYLARVLARRLRITDVAGHLGERRVAVLLPHTSQAGAWKVASDICDRYPVGRGRPNCEVFVYPDQSPPPADRPCAPDQQPVHDAATPLDRLFAHPTPFVKRAIDVAGAVAGLLIASPLILLIAAAIKGTSKGPVFYTQWREGHGGRRFRIYKFRSMCVDAHRRQSSLRALSVQDGPAFKMHVDPRTTWIGRILRRSSLDELPQLWNVLVGDMSLVGPRPLPVDESQQCSRWQRHRLAVVPGLTCIWQVRGRSVVSFEEWMRMDLAYLRDRSLVYDVRLLLSTVPALVLGRGPR